MRLLPIPIRQITYPPALEILYVPRPCLQTPHERSLTILSLFILFAIASYLQPSAAQNSDPHELSTALVANENNPVSPKQIYALMADLFARSYFMDLRIDQHWGPDHPKWQSNYPQFARDLINLSLPEGKTLQSFLIDTLEKNLTREELAQLSARTSDPKISEAVKLLQVNGVTLQFIIQAQGPTKASQLYSRGEHEIARRTAEVLRARAPDIETLKPNFRVLATLMSAPAFLKCQDALENAFMNTAGALESTNNGRQKINVLLTEWKKKI